MHAAGLDSLRVDFESGSAMSAPRVTHAATGQVLVDYWGTGWFGTVTVDHRGRLRLWIRRDRSDVLGHIVVIDPVRGTLVRDYGQGRLASSGRTACVGIARVIRGPLKPRGRPECSGSARRWSRRRRAIGSAASGKSEACRAYHPACRGRPAGHGSSRPHDHVDSALDPPR